MADFDFAFIEIVRKEGPYSNNPKDPGGETKWGITRKYFENLPAIDKPCKRFEDLTQDSAFIIYKFLWWPPYKKIDSQVLANKAILTAINIGNGIERTNTMLQKSVRAASNVVLKLDGSLGPVSLAAINACIPQTILAAFKAYVSAYYDERYPPGSWAHDGLQNRIME